MASIFLKLAGTIVLMIGLSHFVMPSLGYDADVIAGIPELPRDHFVYLGTYAIGSFLVSFAILTFLVDFTQPTKFTTVFLGLMTLVWSIRFVLELLYPVDLSLFILPNPHPVLLVTILFIFASYATAFLRFMRD